MALWLSLFSIIAGCYISFKLVDLHRKSNSLKYLGLTIASFFFIVIQIANFSQNFVDDSTVLNYFDLIAEWGQVLGLAFILSSLAVFIRQSKPVFAQFPMLYTALPLMIIVSYFLVRDTYALKKWLIAIYQGGAIVVGILMYAVYYYRNNKYGIILIGISLLLLSYILFWYVPVIEQDFLWLSEFILIAGLVTTVVGYEQTELLLRSSNNQPQSTLDES